jgi:HlyD family secretion protein
MEVKQNTENTNTDEFLSAVQITSSGIKYFLMCVVFLVVALLLWGFLGRIPIKITGIGIISTGLSETTINAIHHGVVGDIYKKQGDTIHVGEKLMKISDIDLEQEIDEALLELQQKIAENSIQRYSLALEEHKQNDTYTLNKEKLNRQHENVKNKITFYQKVYEEKTALAKDEIINQAELKEAEFNVHEQQILLVDIERQITDIKGSKDVSINEIRLQRTQLEKVASMLQEKLSDLDSKNDKFSFVSSIYDAIILEVLVDKNQMVADGQRVYTVQIINTSSNDLYIDMFIPYSEKARATVGMKTIVAPANVDKNRYGQIIGEITEVGQFPATAEFLSRLLVDKSVVNLFGARGPEYHSRVRLAKDATTISGLKWTSHKGVPYKIATGMICSAEIYVDDVSPISLVIPWFKKELNDEQ